MREKVYTVVFMVVAAAVFTGAVSAVSLLSRERVLLNQALAKQRVVMRVLGIEAPPEAGLREVADLYKERVKESGRSYEEDGVKFPILAGHDAEGKLMGYAFDVGGRGFWDKISGYMAVSPDLKTIQGLAFYQQSETPGLGAEITKPWFEQQFRNKELPPEMAAGTGRIVLQPPGTEKGPYDVDAVTGATQTSKAVERFLNDDLRAALAALKEAR